MSYQYYCLFAIIGFGVLGVFTNIMVFFESLFLENL